MALEPTNNQLEVSSHLPLRWHVCQGEEADQVRSLILDAAVTRSWDTQNSLPETATPELNYLLRRLESLERRVDWLARRPQAETQETAKIHAIQLSAGACRIKLLPAEGIPNTDSLVEIRLTLPLSPDDEIVTLARVRPSIDPAAREFSAEFLCIAQDQADRVVRYLLNRQRLQQTQGK